MSELGLALMSAMRSLREHRNRSLLSMLGILVGSLAIVLLVSIARGVQRDIGQQVEDLGVNLLVVLPGRLNDANMFSPNMAGLSYLQDGDMDRIAKLQGVRAVAPLMFAGGAIHFGKKDSPTTFVIAAGSAWFQVRPVIMQSGRTYGIYEQDKPVCVIGSVAKKNLFGSADAVGKVVNVNGFDYTVIGVTQDKKSEESLFSTGGFENIAYIPYQFARDHTQSPQLHRIMIQTAPDKEPKALVAAVENILGQRLSRDQFSVLTQEDLLKLVYKVMSILTWLLTGLTSIALFVGGVGIMTVMLMGVSERSREIGVRKTVGAQNRQVFWQFFFEAAGISLVGGICGVVLSYVVCLGLGHYTPIKPWITGGTVALGIGTSLGIGALFGVIPAISAARKDPVVAMRNE